MEFNSGFKGLTGDGGS